MSQKSVGRPSLQRLRAREAARQAGGDFQTITTYIMPNAPWTDEMEQVEFVGKHVYEDDDGNYYITSGGRPAIIDKRANALEYADDVRHLDINGVARQALQAALGLVVKPTVLDI